MRKVLIILVIAGAFSSACKKGVASRASEQDKNQAGTTLYASGQTQIASSSKPQNNSQIASFRPKNGYVPDAQTAIAVAIAACTPIYGRNRIESEKPFRATLKNGVWTVTGTLPEGFDLGTAIAELAQDDGRVLRVIHGQ